MIRTLLVGFGFSATTFHLPFLRHLDAYGVTGVVSSRANDVNAVLPDVDVYPTLEEALQQSSFDLVIITTPNVLHAKQSRIALEHGCHVLVEKPFTLCSKEAEALVNLANKKQKKLCVFHNRRFDGDFLTLRALIEQEKFGRIARFESRFDRFRPVPRNRWRENAGPGSGIFWDLGPHLIDQALVLFGEPNQVSANILTLRENGQSDDTFDITLFYDNLVVKLGSSAFQAGNTLRFDMQGTLGSFRKFGLDPQEDQLKASLAFEHSDWAQTPQDEHGSFCNESLCQIVPTLPGNYLGFFNQLAEAIVNSHENIDLPADANSVVAVIKVIEAAIRANESGQNEIF